MSEAQAVYGLVLTGLASFGLIIICIMSGVTAFDAAERANYRLTDRAKIHLHIALGSGALLIAFLIFGWFCVGAKW